MDTEQQLSKSKDIFQKINEEIEQKIDDLQQESDVVFRRIVESMANFFKEIEQGSTKLRQLTE